MEEGILHVELAYGPVSRHSNAEDGADRGWFDDRAERLVVVDAGLLRETANNPARLVSGEGLNSHLPVMMFAPGGRGTRRQMPLSISALYSSAIAARQLGSARALR